MSVRSRRFIEPTTVTGDAAWHTVYTVPTDRTLIAKTITSYVSSAGAVAPLMLAVYTPFGNRGTFRVVASVGAATVDTWTGWLVLTPGDELQVYGGSGAMKCLGAGALLFGAPA